MKNNILETYKKIGTVKGTANALGKTRQTIRKTLRKLGIDTNHRRVNHDSPLRSMKPQKSQMKADSASDVIAPEIFLG